MIRTREEVGRFYEGKRILITGATGFIGNALARWLHEQGALIWTLIRDVELTSPYFRSEFYSRFIEGSPFGDVGDYDSVVRAFQLSKPDLVFHLAATSQVGDCSYEPRTSYQTNIMGTVNILESVRLYAHDAAVVIASSDKAFGKPQELPLRDQTPLNPVHPYDVGKASADIIARSYGQYYGLNAIITRCGNVYGPGDVNWNRLIPGILRDLIYERNPVIRSDGQQVREYNYIDDIVEAYARAGIAMADPFFYGSGPFKLGDAYTISNGSAMKVLRIVDHCRAAIPWGGELMPLVLDQAKDETQELRLDGRRFADAVHFWGATPIAEGIWNTAEWMMEYLLKGIQSWAK